MMISVMFHLSLPVVVVLTPLSLKQQVCVDAYVCAC